MKAAPDLHDFTAIGRLLDMDADEARAMVERWQDTDGYRGPEFSMRYDEVARKTGVSESTLRSRVHDGFYVEGVDYVREGPRTVFFSRRVLKREAERRPRRAS